MAVVFHLLATVSTSPFLFDTPVPSRPAGSGIAIHIHQRVFLNIAHLGAQDGHHIVQQAWRVLTEAKKVMDKKKISVLVFPEGTRSKTGEVQSFKRGAFYLAAHSGYPIVPITINGTKKIMPKGTFRLKSGTVYLHFDKPIPTDNIKTKQDELALMEKVREIIISNQKEYD